MRLHRSGILIPVLTVIFITVADILQKMETKN